MNTYDIRYIQKGQTVDLSTHYISHNGDSARTGNTTS